MEDGTLMNLDDAGVVQKHDDKALDKVISSGAFLPYLQLLTKSSKEVDAGRFSVNHYAMVHNSTYTDLGEEVDIMPVIWRPRATEFGDDGVLSVYDTEDAEFKRIQEIAGRAGMNGCMCGPEYLIWLPGQERFVTFLLGSKSAKKSAGDMNLRLGKGATLKTKFIETKKFSWWTVAVVPCTAELQLPDKELMVETVATFNDPPKDEREKAPETESEGQAR